MYTSFYKFKTDPFAINPDDDFIFESFSWRKARNKIYDALVHAGGAWVIAGPSGMGKTTFCRTMWNNLSMTHRCVFIRNTFIEAPQLMQNINKFFGESTRSGGVEAQLKLLEDYLSRRAKNGEKTILILDEAQNVDGDLLESLLRISFQGSKFSFFIVLSGRYELYQKFASGEETFLPEMKIDLGSFSKEEVAKYIKFCLRQAGNQKVVFNDNAISEIYQQTGGRPLLVSATCRESLEVGVRLRSFSINQAIVLKAFKKVDRDMLEGASNPIKTHFVYLVLISVIFASLLYGAFQVGITPLRVSKEQKDLNEPSPDIVSMMLDKKRGEEQNIDAGVDFSMLDKKQYISSTKLYASLEVLLAWKIRSAFIEELWLLYQKEKDINFAKVAGVCGLSEVEFFGNIDFLKRARTCFILRLMVNGNFDYAVLHEVKKDGVVVKTLKNSNLSYSWKELAKVWMGETMAFVRNYPFKGKNIFIGGKCSKDCTIYIQEFLLSEGLLEADNVSGSFDKKTDSAVRKFQTKYGFTPDGVLDKTQQMYIYMYKDQKTPLIKNNITEMEK